MATANLPPTLRPWGFVFAKVKTVPDVGVKSAGLLVDENDLKYVTGMIVGGIRGYAEIDDVEEGKVVARVPHVHVARVAHVYVVLHVKVAVLLQA